LRRHVLHNTVTRRHSNQLGKQVTFTPDDSRIQPERITLANLEFQNWDVDQIGVSVDWGPNPVIEATARNTQTPCTPWSGLRSVQQKDCQDHIGRRIRRIGERQVAAEASAEDEATAATEGNTQVPSSLSELDRAPPRSKNYQHARKDTLQRHFATHKQPMWFPQLQLYFSLAELIQALSVKVMQHASMTGRESGERLRPRGYNEG